MSSKHTPGPWELAEKFNCVEVRAVDGPYIANCNQSAAIDWRIKEANARLIAAAPEMFEALDTIGGLSRALRQGGPDPMDLQGLSDALEEAVDLANSLVAQIEGRA